jgi:hypothetical protein
MMAGNEAASAAPASSNNSQRPQVDGLSVLANEAASFYLYYPGYYQNLSAVFPSVLSRSKVAHHEAR